MARMVDESKLEIPVDDYLDQVSSSNTKKQNTLVAKMFNDVMDSLNIKKVGPCQFYHLDECPEHELPDSLSRFFMCVVKKDGSVYNASSINTFYQAMARYLMKRDPPVDIKHDPKFKKVSEIVKSRCTESAKSGARPGLNASRAISEDNIQKAFEKGTMGRDTPRALVTLVHYTLTTGFGCRANQVKFISYLNWLFIQYGS